VRGNPEDVAGHGDEGVVPEHANQVHDLGLPQKGHGPRVQLVRHFLGLVERGGKFIHNGLVRSGEGGRQLRHTVAAVTHCQSSHHLLAEPGPERLPPVHGELVLAVPVPPSDQNSKL